MMILYPRNMGDFKILLRYSAICLFQKKNHPSSDENAQELMVFGCFWVPRHSKYPDTEMVCKTTIYSRSI